MSTNHKSVSWHYKVRCSKCSTDISFNVLSAHKSSQIGYDIICPTCQQIFNFTQWQYASSCPGCGHPFEVTMHSMTVDTLAHQHVCKFCGSVLYCSKDSSPHFINKKKAHVISIDINKLKSIKR